LFTAVIFSSGFFSGKYTEKKIDFKNQNQDVYIKFISEIYDKIQENYWEKISDNDLSALFKAGLEKITGVPQKLKSQNKEGVQKLVEKIIKNKEAEKKKEFVAQLGDIVLANLKPFGVSRLYTQKEEKELAEKVYNIEPEVNLYEILGVNKNASQEEIEKTYKTKSSELSKEKTPEAEEKLSQINRAYEALSNPEKRKTYDELGVEPTVISKLVRPDIFYIQIKRISPTILDEFQKVTNSTNNKENLKSLIFDLRGDIGGSVDILPAFLGYFLGQNQIAFEFFRQGEYIPFRTTTDKFPGLAKFKKIVILIDGETQSSAEIITASLKKYNIGVTVGTKTKGWGTIKRVFALDTQIAPNEKYSAFIAHSLVLRDDSQPMEGRGVEPVINIENSDWEKQLFDYLNYSQLVEAVKEIINQK
jgi:C-terminal processing protease CtpA/Prc